MNNQRDLIIETARRIGFKEHQDSEFLYLKTTTPLRLYLHKENSMLYVGYNLTYSHFLKKIKTPENLEELTFAIKK